jgi:hypothetical protein
MVDGPVVMLNLEEAGIAGDRLLRHVVAGDDPKPLFQVDRLARSMQRFVQQ